MRDKVSNGCNLKVLATKLINPDIGASAFNIYNTSCMRLNCSIS